MNIQYSVDESMGSQQSEGGSVYLAGYGAHAVSRLHATSDSGVDAMNMVSGEVHMMQTQEKMRSYNQSRPHKRKRATARKSLQTLFDAAATAGMELHGERNSEMTGSVGMSLASSQTEHGFQVGSVYSESSNFSEEKAAQVEESSRAEVDVPRAPLLALLTSERGSCITLSEIKAIVYSLIVDINDLHSANSVHKEVSIETVVLNVLDGRARAVLRTEDGHGLSLVASMGQGHPRVDGIDSYDPPEMTYCADHKRTLTDKSNMWSIGCLLFALLAGGELPFGELGVGIAGGEVLFMSIDRQQKWLEEYLCDRMEKINGSLLSVINDQTGSSKASQGIKGMKCFGFEDSVRGLLSSLLHVDPAQRMTALHALDHSWFDSVRDLLPSVTNERRSPPMSLLYSSSNKSADHLKRRISISPNVEASPENSCPYPIVGHLSQPLEVVLDGQVIVAKAIHALYFVPGQGTLMSAKPVAIHPVTD